MTKVDIVSGFLGAGKTTLIKKLLKEALKGEQVVLIENEFGEIGIDGGFLKESGVEIKEMNSGCICCTLVGDFETSLKEVLATYKPDRIIIEPSGVGKLSDVIVAVQKATADADTELGSAIVVVDVKKCKMYMKNFGEFFNNQIESAGTVVLSRTGTCPEAKLNEAIELIRGLNEKATIITTDWEKIDGKQILDAMEATEKFSDEVLAEMMEAHRLEAEEHEHEHHHHHDHEEHEHHHHDHDDEEEEHGHHHHHHDDDDEEEEHGHHHHHHDDDDEEEEHGHHHHHDDDDEEEKHGHHHHRHDHDEEEEHEHHHDHEEEHGHHHHHGHHHADDVFTSWGFETPKAFTKAELESILAALGDADAYGTVLRAKGMVPNAEGESWIHFDMVPEETEIRDGAADVTGKICVIGADIHTGKLAELFGNKG